MRKIEDIAKFEKLLMCDPHLISKRLPVFADDEDVTCNVCDRAFCTPRMLDRHKQKKRHWG